MSRKICMYAVAGNTTATDPGGAAAKIDLFHAVTGTLTRINNGGFTMTPDTGTGAAHKIEPLQPGLYRITFSCNFYSADDKLTVIFDIRDVATAIGGTKREFETVEGDGAGVDSDLHCFHIEVLAKLTPASDVCVYLDGDADATAVCKDAILIVEKLD